MFAIHLNIQPKGRTLELENHVILEEVDSLCGHVGFNEMERTDVKLEDARMKLEIVDMKQVIADILGDGWHEISDKYVNIWSSTICRQ